MNATGGASTHTALALHDRMWERVWEELRRDGPASPLNEPVCTAPGAVYEREELLAWFAKGTVDPATQEPLPRAEWWIVPADVLASRNEPFNSEEFRAGIRAHVIYGDLSRPSQP